MGLICGISDWVTTRTLSYIFTTLDLWSYFLVLYFSGFRLSGKRALDSNSNLDADEFYPAGHSPDINFPLIYDTNDLDDLVTWSSVFLLCC